MFQGFDGNFHFLRSGHQGSIPIDRIGRGHAEECKAVLSGEDRQVGSFDLKFFVARTYADFRVLLSTLPKKNQIIVRDVAKVGLTPRHAINLAHQTRTTGDLRLDCKIGATTVCVHDKIRFRN